MMSEKIKQKILKKLRPPIDERDKELLEYAIDLTQKECQKQFDEFKKRLKEELPEVLTNEQKLGGKLFKTHKIIDKIASEVGK